MSIILFLLLAFGILSCASPTILSGADLKPEEQAQLRGRRGVKFLQIGGETVDGRWIILEPGPYDVEFLSTQDGGSVVSAFKGVIEELTCNINLELQPGEEVYIAPRMKKGPSRFSGGYSQFDFHTVVRIDSSIEGRSREVDTSKCGRRMNCKKVDRTQVVPVGCN